MDRLSITDKYLLLTANVHNPSNISGIVKKAGFAHLRIREAKQNIDHLIMIDLIYQIIIVDEQKQQTLFFSSKAH